MKRLVSLVAVAFAAAALVAAQTGFAVGIKGDIALSLGTTLEGTQKEAADLLEKAGAKVAQPVSVNGGGGIYGRYAIPNALGLGLQLEALFNANQGCWTELYGGGVDVKIGFFYTAIDIPLMLTYDLPVGPVALRFGLGPNFSIPVGKVSSKISSGGTDISQDSGDLKVSRFLVGMAADAGCAFGVWPGSVVASLRYTNDFMPLQIDGEKYLTRRNLSLSAGYEFKF